MFENETNGSHNIFQACQVFIIFPNAQRNQNCQLLGAAQGQKCQKIETRAWVGQGVYINEDTHNIGDFDLAN